MIDRTAVLNLRSSLEDGRVVMITLDSGQWITVDEIIGVQADSHVIFETDKRTVLVPLDKISMIEIASDTDEVLLEA